MPRNKHKARCQVPGSRNWAMRGHTRCRAHRDALADLQSHVADHQLAAELSHFLRQFPPANREQVRELALASLPPSDPEYRLRTFRELVAYVEAELDAQASARGHPPFVSRKRSKNKYRNQDPDPQSLIPKVDHPPNLCYHLDGHSRPATSAERSCP